MCKARKTSEYSLLELPPWNIVLETVSSVTRYLLIIIDCLVWVRVLSLADAVDWLPHQNFPTEVLWIIYSCALMWIPLSLELLSKTEATGAFRTDKPNHMVKEIELVVASGDWGWALTFEGHEITSCSDGHALYLDEVWITQVYTFVKTLWTMHIRSMLTTVCILDFNFKK